MDFNAYDTAELDRYEQQAKARWGGTDAWHEYEQKTSARPKEELRSAGDALMDIFADLGAVKHLSPSSDEAQSLIQKLRDHITANYYTCTPQILRGLSQMYIAGDSMTENIDRAGGPGTAQFAHDAIAVYCK